VLSRANQLAARIKAIRSAHPATFSLPRFSTSQHQTSTGFTSGHEADGGIRHGLFTTIALMRSFAE
jgi:hypothetical protein